MQPPIDHPRFTGRDEVLDQARDVVAIASMVYGPGGTSLSPVPGCRT